MFVGDCRTANSKYSFMFIFPDVLSKDYNKPVPFRNRYYFRETVFPKSTPAVPKNKVRKTVTESVATQTTNGDGTPLQMPELPVKQAVASKAAKPTPLVKQSPDTKATSPVKQAVASKAAKPTPPVKQSPKPPNQHHR